MYLDASACSKDLLTMADRFIRIEFVGQNGCNKGAYQPRVVWLDSDELHTWASKNLGCDTEYHKW